MRKTANSKAFEARLARMACIHLHPSLTMRSRYAIVRACLFSVRAARVTEKLPNYHKQEENNRPVTTVQWKTRQSVSAEIVRFSFKQNSMPCVSARQYQLTQNPGLDNGAKKIKTQELNIESQALILSEIWQRAIQTRMKTVRIIYKIFKYKTW